MEVGRKREATGRRVKWALAIRVRIKRVESRRDAFCSAGSDLKNQDLGKEKVEMMLLVLFVIIYIGGRCCWNWLVSNWLLPGRDKQMAGLPKRWLRVYFEVYS